MNTHTLDQFRKLVALPGVSGQEKAIATYLKDRFDKLGWMTWLDDSGSKNDSTSGNLYALLEVDPAVSTRAFCAHMDTVIKSGQVVTMRASGDEVSSDGTTVLGADDRAGICALMLAAESFAKVKPPNNILYFFSTREEAGVMGSTFFRYKRPLQYIFNVDGTDKPGVFITRALGYMNFSIVITGLAAHAARDYEKGRSAIVAAGDILQRLPHGGNRDEGWTLNIGTIHGGSGINVIPDELTMKGELRAFDTTMLDTMQQQIVGICQQIATQQGVTVKYVPDEASYTPPFLTPESSDILQVCKKACHEVDLRPNFKTSYSTSDANHLVQAGVPTITVGRGGAHVHSNNEVVKLSEIAATTELIKALARS